MTFSKTAFALAAFAFSAGAVSAASVTPLSYDMRNGDTGSYNYWDDSYDGSGNKTQDYSLLSGGTGDLTDGYIETQNWNVVEPPVGPNGPYVGWNRSSVSITFNFDSAYDFNSATFYFDDAAGGGGVRQPGRVNINTTDYTVPTNPGPAPFAFSADLTGLTTDTLDVTIYGTGQWIFLSEVEFDAGVDANVPLPASALLLAAGIGGLGLARARRKG